MPNINLTDSGKRDAVVKAEPTGNEKEIRYIDVNGNNASSRKILKASVKHNYDTLISQHDDDAEKLARALIDTDPEVDIEKCGLFLWGVSRVYVNSDDGIVYRIEQFELVRDPDGEQRERRPRQRAEANVDSEIPLTWTGRKIDRQQASRRFLFSSKLQIVHINGLTYDFLYGMARELANSDSMMMVGGGQKGRDPLVFRRGSIPYRGFLEGRVQGDRYILLLHLSNMELKLPQPQQQADTEELQDSSEQQKPVRKKRVSELADEKSGKAAKAARKKTADKKTTGKKSAGKKTTSKKTADKKTTSTKTAVKKTSAHATADPAKATSVTASTDSSDASAHSIEPSNEDLGVWLKSIRMGKYLELFIENEIDVDVLPQLTDDDLKELNIPVGSRRRLLSAVADTDNLRAEVAMAVSKIRSSAARRKKPAAKQKGKTE